jgi:sodium/bile acid cotransporter 7
MVGARTTVPFASIFMQLSMTVLVPLLIGQVVRRFTKEWLERKTLPFGAISSGILLTIIYTTFCDTFSKADGQFSGSAVLRVAIIVVLCQCLFIFIAYVLATAIGSYTRHDIIAIIFCSTHKSLTLGIPILKIVFGSSDHLSSMTLPLLVYHPTQILLGSALVPFLHSWVSQLPSPPGLPLVSSRTATPDKEET